MTYVMLKITAKLNFNQDIHELRFQKQQIQSIKNDKNRYQTNFLTIGKNTKKR